MINILSLFLMFEKYAVQLAQLHQTGRQLAVLAHSQEENIQTQDIELVKAEYVRPLINIMGYQGCLIVNGCVMHKWTGYDLEGESTEETAADKMVFVTAYGSVYHTSRNCSYLNPAVTMLERSAVSEALNRDGVRYQACRLCRGENKLVYITEDGDCFHASITCSGLKRTVSCVLQSEAIAEGKNACSRCRSG